MRICTPALKQFFDKKLDGYTRQADPTAFMIMAATACKGITDDGDPDDVALFQSAIFNRVGQAWCLDFVQACIAYTEATFKVTSPLPATQLCTDLWARSALYSAVTPPKGGDLVVWKLGNTILGHCGIVLSQDSLRFTTVEGNTSQFGHIGEIDRDGSGVWIKQRAKGGTKTFTELGFLRVFGP